MKRKGFYIFVFFIMIASNAMAYEWKAAGFLETGSGVNGEENYLLFKYNNTTEIKVRYHGELADSWAEKIVELNTRLHRSKYMKPGNMEFFITGESLEILIIPSSFKYLETDFMPYIPGGITFIYDYDLRYNFRITKNNIFLRLNDKYVNEELLCKRMKEAVDDPISYLKKRDPEYFLQKLNELEENMAILKNSQEKLVQSVMFFENSGFLGFGNTPVKSSVIKRVVELKTSDPAMDKDKIKETLSKEKIDATDKEIKLILNVFYNEFK
jgi:hypothetical protein